MKILITGGKSAKALKLMKAFTGHEVFLADYGEIPAFPSSGYKFITLGEANDAIAHNLLNICLDHGIQVVLPIHQFEINPVAKSAVLFEEFNIQVLLPSVSEVLNYFYPQEDIHPGLHWYVFYNGALQYPEWASSYVSGLGKEKGLNGVYYIPEASEELTAILFTIP